MLSSVRGQDVHHALPYFANNAGVLGQLNQAFYDANRGAHAGVEQAEHISELVTINVKQIPTWLSETGQKA
jgi:hypothetical protein